MPLQSVESVNNLFGQFRNLKVLIIGDVMIDSYLWGKVDRISPEAPVPIVAVNRRANRLGGAANVALNIKALGAVPLLCSVIGNDDQGAAFLSLLDEKQLCQDGILRSNKRVTTTKFRVIGNNTQMLRVDEEVDHPLDDKDQTAFFENLCKLFSDRNIDAVIFQDYDKGVITPGLISDITALARAKNIPVVVDPKKRNFESYRNVTMFKPNLKELREGLGIKFEVNDKEALRQAIRLLHQKQDLEVVLATLSEEGILISRRLADASYRDIHVPAQLRTISDVSGAGDTVVSVAALCLALGLPDEDLAALSNLAGGQVCEKVGVVPVDMEKFKNEIISLNL